MLPSILLSPCNPAPCMAASPYCTSGPVVRQEAERLSCNVLLQWLLDLEEELVRFGLHLTNYSFFDLFLAVPISMRTRWSLSCIHVMLVSGRVSVRIWVQIIMLHFFFSQYMWCVRPFGCTLSSHGELWRDFRLIRLGRGVW